PVAVINFGVPGYTAFQGEKLYPARVRPLAPDVVVLAFGAVNENSARDPSAAERYRVTSRTHPAATAVSNALMRFRGYQLLRFLVAAARGEDRAAESARRRFFENLERRERGQAYTRNVDVPQFRESLRALIRAAREDDARPLLVSPPRSPQVEAARPELLEYTRAIFEVGRETRTPVCDVRRGFQVRRDARLLRDSVHPGGRGHRLYAELLRDCFVREGILSQSGGASGPPSREPALDEVGDRLPDQVVTDPVRMAAVGQEHPLRRPARFASVPPVASPRALHLLGQERAVAQLRNPPHHRGVAVHEGNAGLARRPLHRL
ncbi:MAG: hypothetical protein JSU66_13765, partial [Deltaproteobacteria bacterium]